MVEILCAVVVSVILVLIFHLMNGGRNPPIFGIYQQRNKTFWFKYVLMYSYLKVRQLIVYLKHIIVEDTTSAENGTMHVWKYQAKLEQLHDLGDFAKSVDGVYFNGMSEDGEAIVCGLARRPNRCCDAFIYLKIKDEDLLLTPSLPDTCLQKSSDDGEGHSVQGISIKNFIPMRTWNISYNGEMKTKSNTKVQVSAELVWSALWSPFEYDTQMSASCMAEDISREPWSRDYFKLLKKLHQTHYEQAGYISGNVRVNENSYNINMPCVRDRTFGQLREWRNFHRYVYHFIFLQNGDFIAVGTVSQPSVLSHLTIGYVCVKENQSVTAISGSDFKLYQHGENQVMPNDYGFVFQAGELKWSQRLGLCRVALQQHGAERALFFAASR
nr:uncharacterized protein LOC116773432 [Danaus plexippus plexippus]